MYAPVLVEDSTAVEMAPSLEKILKLLGKNATHHDHLVALLIVLLAECGFYLPTNNSSECKNSSSVHIPEDWKSKETGSYGFCVALKDVPNVECKLVAVPSGDILIINFFPIKEKQIVHSLAVQTLRYVNPFSSDPSCRYVDLKSISHRLKDSLFTPIRTTIMNEAKLINPSLQGLPPEIKIKILSFLDEYSVKQLARCSHEFYELSTMRQLRRAV